MADEEKIEETQEAISGENRRRWSSGGNESSKRRDRSRSPFVGRRGGRGGRGGRRGGYKGWDRSADEVGNKTDSEDPYMQRARLFVGNIASDKVTRRDLAELFSRYGKVMGVSIHNGFAFVQMDRERNANRAVLAEDNQLFKGNKLHVEFSSAALKAGARVQPMHSPPSTRDRGDSRDFGYMRTLEAELEREDRLARLIDMERDLAYMRAREDVYGELYVRSQLDATPYERPREEGYRRPLSPPLPSNPYASPRDYGMEPQEHPSERRPYYNRSDGISSAARQTSDARMELLSYPIPRNRSGPRGTDLLASAYGGAATTSKNLGYGGTGGGGYSTGKSGGYGSGKGGAGGSNPPPGWPTAGYQRGSGSSRGPFSGGYWN